MQSIVPALGTVLLSVRSSHGICTGEPPRNTIGLVLSSNWMGFVVKTLQPWLGMWRFKREWFCVVSAVLNMETCGK